MAFKSYILLSGSEFDNIVSKKDEVQDLTINQSKLEVHLELVKNITIRRSIQNS